ncbi:MAG TPA: glycosyltransferase family 4 protein [Gaiellaceae bacterium]|nr:glycosyltransferase family 4 protein [Gaiellaceae bacterium]
MTRALFVGRSRYELPLSPSLRAKWDAVGRELDFRVVASSAGASTGDGRFRLRPRTRLDGPLFWLTLPLRVRREVHAFRPRAIVAQSPFEGAAALAARTSADVVVEVHGDWRTFGRLYGSPARRVLARALDGVGAWAVRRAAKVRAVSPYTARLVREAGREPDAVFPAYMDLEPFTAPVRPLPNAPVALFVGVLEAYKNVDGLAAAWRIAAPRLPTARLRIVGRGARRDVVEALVREGLATWDERLSTAEVARALDEASLLVLPSRSEGMGRVVIEAQLRGRPVVGSAVGGIPDLVDDGVDGVLVAPEPEALADALVRLLGDRAQLERLAANARAAGERWLTTPEEYAQRVRELVER